MVSLDVQQHLKRKYHRARQLCESRGGRAGLPSIIVLMVSVDLKQH